MARLAAKICLVLLSLSSIVAVYYYMFTGQVPDELSPEEINDMFQNKKSEVSVKRVELPEFGVASPYLDKHTLQSPNWDLAGDIVVQNGQYISLSSDNKHQASTMFSKTAAKAESFEMELTFHLHTTSVLPADGFAVWFVENALPLGDIFGAQNNFRGLGITVDTFRNGRNGNFPLVSAHYGPGYTFFEKHTDGQSSMRASCTAKSLMNPASGKSRMRIVHTKNGYLSVDFNHDPDHSGEWHNCFSVADVTLPPQFHIGFSAETGELFENVDILESKIFALYTPNGDHFVESLDELETIMEQQIPAELPEDSQVKKRTRRSMTRLRNAERRIKEKERAHRLEKYGDADATFVRRTWKKVVAGFKYALYAFGALFFLWVVRVAIKSRKGKRGSRKSGLLD